MLKYMRPRVNSFSKNTETENWTVKSHSTVFEDLAIAVGRGTMEDELPLFLQDVTEDNLLCNSMTVFISPLFCIKITKSP